MLGIRWKKEIPTFPSLALPMEPMKLFSDKLRKELIRKESAPKRDCQITSVHAVPNSALLALKEGLRKFFFIVSAISASARRMLVNNLLQNLECEIQV